MYIICQSLTVPFCLAMLMYCESPRRPGVSVPYQKGFPQNTTAISLNSTCNANCGTFGILDEVMPLCGSDNQQDFKPCYAECKKNEKCSSFGLGVTNRINDSVLFSKGCNTEYNPNWDHYEMNDCQGKPRFQFYKLTIHIQYINISTIIII